MLIKILKINILLLIFSTCLHAQTYDLVILNGRVIDPETRLDGIRNIGISNGRIEVVTDTALKGKKTIDARDLVVAPGFIDMHVHAQDPFSTKVMLRDGVTSQLEIEIGAYPVDAYYKRREGKAQANYGVSASHPSARMAILDKVNPDGLVMYSGAINKAAADGSQWGTKPTDKGTKERAQIILAVEKGLRQGALGIAFPVGYYTAVTGPEIAEVAQLAKRYDTFFTSHVRYLSQASPTGYIGVQEMMAVAEAYDVPYLIHHVSSNCLSYTQDCLQLLNAARKRGSEVATEFYPYERGSTIAGADYLGKGFQSTTGMNYSDITLANTGEEVTEDSFKKLRKESPGTTIIIHHIQNEDMMIAIADPYAFVGSDAMPLVGKNGMPLSWDAAYEDGRGHPRASGSHAKFLRIVRETNVIPLMHAVAKLSFYQAQFMEDSVPQMKERGRIQPGMVADITIFDPQRVTENSTYKIGENALPSTGIPYVVVNGTVVVEDSKVLKGVYPGQAIRNPVLD